MINIFKVWKLLLNTNKYECKRSDSEQSYTNDGGKMGSKKPVLK